MGAEQAEFALTEEEQKQMQDGPAETIQAQEAPAEPTPPPAPAPAQQAEKVVPLAALLESREREREYKRQLKELDEVKKQILALRQQQQPQQPPIPAFDEDPLTHMKERLKQVDSIEHKQEVLLMQQQQEYQKAHLRTVIGSQEAEFRSKHNDYDNAVNFLTEFRKQELAELGVTDPVQINQILAQNAIGLWQQATVAGKNPPEVVYSLAKRYGYKSESAPLPPQAAQAAEKIETKQQADLKAIESGQQATKTLSGSGKTANDTDISIQALLDADPAEFDKMWKEKFKNAK